MRYTSVHPLQLLRVVEAWPNILPGYSFFRMLLNRKARQPSTLVVESDVRVHIGLLPTEVIDTIIDFLIGDAIADAAHTLSNAAAARLDPDGTEALTDWSEHESPNVLDHPSVSAYLIPRATYVYSLYYYNFPQEHLLFPFFDLEPYASYRPSKPHYFCVGVSDWSFRRSGKDCTTITDSHLSPKFIASHNDGEDAYDANGDAKVVTTWTSTRTRFIEIDEAGISRMKRHRIRIIKFVKLFKLDVVLCNAMHFASQDRAQKTPKSPAAGASASCLDRFGHLTES